MTVERALRMMAGIVILASMALAHYVSPYWYLLTAFVGLNLLQSAFTNWCPAMAIFRWMGLKDATNNSQGTTGRVTARTGLS
jgi:Inner membrane protein YgaP-like, transmembrane domain